MGLIKIHGAFGSMVVDRVVLGLVVAMVCGTRHPVDAELALSDAVSDPVKAHVDGFGAALLDSVIDDAVGHFVVRLDGSCRLGVTESFQRVADGAAFLGIVEKGCDFGFRGR